MNPNSFIFLLLLLAIALLGAYHSLSAVPVETAFTRFFALSGFVLLSASLIMGPLAVLRPKQFAVLIEPRRAVGLAAFIFAFVHILISLGLTFGWKFGILLRSPGFIAAVPATLLLFVLAVTSSDYAIRLLGPALWKNVQRFNYLAFILVFLHFILKSNGLLPAEGGALAVNFAEWACIVLGAATVSVQAAGFLARRKMQAENRAKSQSAGTPPSA